MTATTQPNHPATDPTATKPTVENPIEQACRRLKAAGLRITQPRISILSALLVQKDPITIEQLHDSLNRRSCDLVTVYRCLAVFEELGIVRRAYFNNGTSLYQIQLEGDPVYHVVSKTDNTVTRLSSELTADLRDAVKKIEETLKQQGYTGVSHTIGFFATPPSHPPLDIAAGI